jgi:hypothetical protein
MNPFFIVKDLIYFGYINMHLIFISNKTDRTMPKTSKIQAPAEITLDQIGGRQKLRAMTGASIIQAKENNLLIVLPRAKAVEIKYDAELDLYTAEYYQIKKDHEKKMIKSDSKLYADMLIQWFEKTTGLYLSL